MRQLIFAIVVLIASAAQIGAADDLHANEMIIGGGHCEVDGFGIGGPSLFLRRGTPGVVVATIQPPGGTRWRNTI